MSPNQRDLMEVRQEILELTDDEQSEVFNIRNGIYDLVQTKGMLGILAMSLIGLEILSQAEGTMQ